MPAVASGLLSDSNTNAHGCALDLANFYAVANTAALADARLEHTNAVANAADLANVDTIPDTTTHNANPMCQMRQ